MNTKDIFQSEDEEIRINEEQLQQLLENKDIRETVSLICEIALSVLRHSRKVRDGSEAKPTVETKMCLNFLTDVFSSAENFETLMKLVHDGTVELIYNPVSTLNTTKESKED